MFFAMKETMLFFILLLLNQDSLKAREITDVYPVHVEIGEVLRKDGVLTSRQVSTKINMQPNLKETFKPKEGKGNFEVNLHMYSDSTYNELMSSASDKAERSVKYQDVFYELSLDEQFIDITMTLQKCYATPTENREDPLNYLILDDGCPIDETFQVYQTDSEKKIRFSITSFRFVHSNLRTFYLHCVVNICGKFQPDSCSNGCNDARRKRSFIPKTVTALTTRENEQKNLEELSDHGFHLQCRPNQMILSLKKPLSGNIDVNSLHLNEPTCTADANSSHINFYTNHHECGSNYVNYGKTVFYTNNVIEPKPDLIIIRRELLKIPFKCSYPSKISSSTVKVQFDRPLIKFRSRAFGTYKVNIGIYKDGSYTEKFHDSLVEVNPDRDMYFQVRIKSKQFDLGLFLDKCFGLPMYYADKKEMYTFIENGCGVDDTLKFHKSADVSTVRFSLKPFTFEEASSNVIINCDVTACSASSQVSKCRKGCQAV